jgi:hypothetical protein
MGGYQGASFGALPHCSGGVNYEKGRALGASSSAPASAGVICHCAQQCPAFSQGSRRQTDKAELPIHSGRRCRLETAANRHPRLIHAGSLRRAPESQDGRMHGLDHDDCAEIVGQDIGRHRCEFETRVGAAVENFRKITRGKVEEVVIVGEMA